MRPSSRIIPLLAHDDREEAFAPRCYALAMSSTKHEREDQKPAPSKGARRYVIQRHHYAGMIHYDFMFEVPGKERLRTFQLTDEPTPDFCSRGISAREIAWHRKEYLSYEGEISGDRGRVGIWDLGQIRLVREEERFIELNLISVRERPHPPWVMHFRGGTDWFLFTPELSWK